MKKPIVFFLCFFCIFFCFAKGQKFFFKYPQGQTYRISGEVQEDVFVNGRFDHSSRIINRIGVHVGQTDSQGFASHVATFMTSEQAYTTNSSNVAQWGETYESVFQKDKLGHYKIGSEYFMPTVRNVPVFLDEEIQVGKKWSEKGYECHDMRAIFGMKEPLIAPFEASYEYQGQETQNIDGKEIVLDRILVNYTLKVFFPEPKDVHIGDFPVATTGYSNQTIFWNQQKGQIEYYYEDFKITLDTFRGKTYDFVGKSTAKVTEFDSPLPSTQEEKVKNLVQDLDIQDLDVKKTKEGLVLTLENIQFLPDSAVLQDKEKQKLEKIAKILQQFPNNDILVSGHTAKSGTEENRQKLSKSRADVVANFLIQKNAKTKDKVFSKGFGSDVPIASNDTEEGMKKNRRVEITILDK